VHRTIHLSLIAYVQWLTGGIKGDAFAAKAGFDWILKAANV